MFAFKASQPLFPEILELHGRWQHDKEALVCGEQRVSWPTFAGEVKRFGSALVKAGIQKGDRVVVLMGNGLPMAITLFGVMAAGAVSVPINPAVTDEAIAAMIEDSAASAVIVAADQQPRVEGATTDGLLRITTGPGGNGWQQWKPFFKQGVSADRLPEIDGEDLLNIIYSSGTTGVPKGIVHTHRGRLDWASDLAIALRYHPSARTVITIGMYSNISWVAMLCTLLAGGTLVIEERFDARALLRTIERERITNIAMVPIQYQRLVQEYSREPAELGSLSAVMSCGSPLQPGLKQDLFKLLDCGVIELYGLTEGVITTLQPEDASGRWASVGRPLAGTDIRIINEQGEEVATGEAGEIVARGRITMRGYLNREEANREACWIDPEGVEWLRTGDIGRVDELGYLYVVDRKKDLILSGGQNIYPQDIEAVVIGHPAVDDVAVIPAKSERWGETPVALVVPVDESADKSGIMTWCNERLGRQQRVADVLFVENLPRNPNGKILKRRLREQ